MWEIKAAVLTVLTVAIVIGLVLESFRLIDWFLDKIDSRINPREKRFRGIKAKSIRRDDGHT